MKSSVASKRPCHYLLNIVCRQVDESNSKRLIILLTMSYRAGREIEGAFFNGSDVNTDLQNFLLLGCPRGPKDTRRFFRYRHTAKDSRDRLFE